MALPLDAPHGWVRLSSYGGKWHRASCMGTPACGAQIRKDAERADTPPLPPQSGQASICVACFRAAVGIDPGRCEHGKAEAEWHGRFLRPAEER